jgi:hypothetical protein
MKFFNLIIFKLVHSFLTRDKHMDFIGPVHHGSVEASELQEFRDRILRQSAPYLFSEEAQAVENSIQLNPRSYHFGIKYKGEITAYVRLTPSQFELTKICHTFETVAKHYEEYIEFNRLVGDPTVEKRGFFARMLLLYVGLWLFSKSNYKGIIATCRDERLSFLTSFGIKPLYGVETYLTERKGNYNLLVGSKSQILSEIFKKYLTNNRMFSSQYKRTVS